MRPTLPALLLLAASCAPADRPSDSGDSGYTCDPEAHIIRELRFDAEGGLDRDFELFIPSLWWRVDVDSGSHTQDLRESAMVIRDGHGYLCSDDLFGFGCLVSDWAPADQDIVVSWIE